MRGLIARFSGVPSVSAVLPGAVMIRMYPPPGRPDTTGPAADAGLLVTSSLGQHDRLAP